METDPLQQLKGIQLPPDPSWWPPAIGWWVIAIILIALLCWALNTAYRAWQARAPIRAAGSLYADLHQKLRDFELDQVSFANGCNEILKRLLVHSLGQTELGPQSGALWLQALDNISDSQAFTSGGGECLGLSRFGVAPVIDTSGLHEAMQLLLSKVQP